MPDNPFIYSRAIRPKEFLGRERELRSLFSRLNTCQSTALVGYPHVGKTSMLAYISDDDIRRVRMGDQAKKDIVVMLDAHMMRGIKTQSGFWSQVLLPIAERLENSKTEDANKLAALYSSAETNGYGLFVLEQFFKELYATGSRMLLFLDEFDAFLSHPVLNDVEFFGGLRSLASRLDGLILVIAIRHELEQLNTLTETINPYGSPFFNIFTEIKVGALTVKAFEELLARADDAFDSKDRAYVSAVSGRHPYLAQITAAKLWEAHEEGETGTERYVSAGRAIYSEAKQHFADTWKAWTNAERKVVTAVALNQIPSLLGNHDFLLEELIKDLADYGSELETLEKHGIVTTNNDIWVLTQVSFLWWLADEIRKNLRTDADFQSWLKDQLMDGPLTGKEKRLIKSAAKKVVSIAGKGATSLIEGFAKGFGQGLVTA